ncbi:phage tail protein [Listeria monocytogenes]|nr:phage tail protein [Listeria monocytogenes]
MAAKTKLVKIGLKNFKYMVLDGTNVIKKIPGLVSAKFDVAMETQTFSADDGTFLTLDGGIGETTLDIELADISSEDAVNLLGIKLEDGIEKYGNNISPPEVAVSFDATLSNKKFIHFGLLRGTFSIPSFDLGTMEEGKPNPQTDTIQGKFMPRDEDGYTFFKGRDDNQDFTLSDFQKQVFGQNATEEDDSSNVVHVTSVSLSKNTSTLNAGDSETLTATILPLNATDKSGTWSSTDDDVVTVDQSGEVTAPVTADGLATVTFTTTDGAKTASCDYTVTL